MGEGFWGEGFWGEGFWLEIKDEQGRRYEFGCRIQPGGPTSEYGVLEPGASKATVASSSCYELQRGRTYKVIAHYSYADREEPPPPPPPEGVVPLRHELVSKPITFTLE
jgi:hypothetical protein